jgi:hypothetical protein
VELFNIENIGKIKGTEESGHNKEVVVILGWSLDGVPLYMGLVIWIL